MSLRIAISIFFVCGLVSAARAQSETPDRVRFFGELGFEDFLLHEPDVRLPPEITIDDSPQRSLLDAREVSETTMARFAFHATPSQHFMGLSFGSDTFTRFYQSAIGAEFSLYLHAMRGLDVFISVEWAWFTGRDADISGVRTELDDFNLYTLLFGIRPFTDLSRLIGADSDFLSNFIVDMRLAAGAAPFEGAWRLRPAPEQWFWSPSTMGVLHAGIGIEVKLLDLGSLGAVSLMAEQGFRFYSSPAEYSASRPDNEIGPFAYAVFQAGLFFRLNFN